MRKVEISIGKILGLILECSEGEAVSTWTGLAREHNVTDEEIREFVNNAEDFVVPDKEWAINCLQSLILDIYPEPDAPSLSFLEAVRAGVNSPTTNRLDGTW